MPPCCSASTWSGRSSAPIPPRSLTENLRSFAEVWPALVDRATAKGVKIAIENCPMLFSGDEWPFGTNLARTPHIWREMFNVIPDAGFGLNLDPSHLVWQMIDYERVVYDFADRILHVHAKDMEIDRGGLYEHGVLSAGMNWQMPRLPGLGEVRWDRFCSALYAVGYDRWISIEHEDRAFEGDEELVKRGFLIARDALRPYVTESAHQPPALSRRRRACADSAVSHQPIGRAEGEARGASASKRRGAPSCQPDGRQHDLAQQLGELERRDRRRCPSRAPAPRRRRR